MAITLLQARDRVRERADQQNSKFISDSELDVYINGSYSELYDILIAKYEDQFLADPFDFSISNSSDPNQSLPANFYKLRGVDRLISANTYRPVGKFNFQNRNRKNFSYAITDSDVRYRIMGGNIRLSPPNSAPGSYRLWFIPRFTQAVVGVLASKVLQDITYTAKDLYANGDTISIEYTTGATAGSEVVTVVGEAISVQIDSGVSTATQVLAAINGSSQAIALVSAAITGSAGTAQVSSAASNLSGSVVQIDIDGVLDFEDYIVIDAAIKCLTKEESDTTALERAKLNMTQRVLAMSSGRDSNEPDTIIDVYNTGYNDGWTNG